MPGEARLCLGMLGGAWGCWEMLGDSRWQVGSVGSVGSSASRNAGVPFTS